MPAGKRPPSLPPSDLPAGTDGQPIRGGAQQAFERLTQQKKILTRKVAQLEADLVEERERTRKAEVITIFVVLGLPVLYADLYRGEPDPQAIANWADEFEIARWAERLRQPKGALT